MSDRMSKRIRVCRAPACEKAGYSGGYCWAHYLAANSHRICSVKDCEGIASTRGWCQKHYTRWQRTGDPLGIRRPPRARITGNGYVRLGGRWMHRVVLMEKIGAGEHPCHWCGATLTWGAGQSPDALHVDHLDNDPTNNQPDNLVPSCPPCNKGRANSRRSEGAA